jgi:putative hydrolase of the HAD superfamily
VRALKVKPSECLMVGDWPKGDIEGARRLGMSTAFAKYGNPAFKGKSHADHVLHRIGDVIKIVARV